MNANKVWEVNFIFVEKFQGFKLLLKYWISDNNITIIKNSVSAITANKKLLRIRPNIMRLKFKMSSIPNFIRRSKFLI